MFYSYSNTSPRWMAVTARVAHLDKYISRRTVIKQDDIKRFQQNVDNVNWTDMHMNDGEVITLEHTVEELCNSLGFPKKKDEPAEDDEEDLDLDEPDPLPSSRWWRKMGL